MPTKAHLKHIANLPKVKIRRGVIESSSSPERIRAKKASWPPSAQKEQKVIVLRREH